MYSTCIFCQRPLGSNDVLESFPVGRRIAFDAEKGRLWVVCGRCERWNLSPLEERWEAIEDAERLFRDTRLRVSTEHVGLARLREGLELVRVGRPMRPEFAAWRYGDQFGRRRRRAILIGAGVLGAVGTVAVAGFMTGFISFSVLAQSGNFYSAYVNHRTLVRVPTGDGGVIKLKQRELSEARIKRGEENDLVVQFTGSSLMGEPWAFAGPEAERVAALLMPRVNAGGARRDAVQQSVQEIERAGGPGEFITELLNEPLLPSWLRKNKNEGIAVGGLPLSHRLAFEMALHEEQERRALQGELKGLELAWRAAEEVAGIADNLLVPDNVRDRLSR